MVTFSANTVYIITFTDIVKGTISIPKDSIITDQFDITLIGKSRLDYGQALDENLLHLLENFACPQDESPPFPNIVQPDLSQVTNPILQQPKEGQFWFNKTDLRLYVLDNTSVWNPVKLRGDISATSGIIAHGQQIPLPSGITSYDECSWFVSPQYVDQQANYIACYTDSNAVVFTRYRSINSINLVDGLANYIIIGNKNTTHHYVPIVSVTPTLTPAMMSTLTPSPTVTPTPTPNPGSSATPTPTVAPTNTVTVTPTFTVTPTITRTITQTVTPSPSPSAIAYLSYILVAGTYNPVIPTPFGFAPGPYVYYGFINTIIGSLSPTTFKGYNIFGINCAISTAGNIPSILIISFNGAPQNIFSQIQFVDKFGIFRGFTSASATYSTSGTSTVEIPNNSTFYWTIPSVLFDAGNTYNILITP